jgi:Spy/CpxP family protein refolding chaperone
MVRYRTWLMVVTGLALGAPGRAQGQNPEARAQRLRMELEQRFVAQMRQSMGLTADQETRLRDVMGSYAERRRQLEVQERQLRQALNGQLRPGIAANPDSVNRLVDGIGEVRVTYAQLLRDELRDLAGVLTPVQRGQMFLIRERIFQRAQELRDLRGRTGPPDEAGFPGW